MVKRWIIYLLMLALMLSGCGGGQGENTGDQPELTPRPNALTPSDEEASPPGTPGTGFFEERTEPSEQEVPVSLSLEMLSIGEWPLDCTLETLQFVGGEDETRNVQILGKAVAAGLRSMSGRGIRNVPL